jgi:predicted ATPase
MPHPLNGGLEFTPTLDAFATQRAGTASTVLSGGNNSGKSLVLKYLKSTMGKTAYMVGANRFYHVYHFSTALRDPNELDQFENNFQSNFWQEQYNYEQNYIDLNRIIVGLSDQQRNLLFELCGSLIGSRFGLKKLDPDNELSVRYIDVDGLNLSVASTGTRLLMTILGICMDDRFQTLLIDEPELGLSPRVQRALSDFLHDPEERGKFFPHLNQVVLATHSSLFLNRRDLTGNFVVAKSGTSVTLSQISSVAEYHRLQFNLLGNSLENLFFPAAIVYTEGPTDQKYLDRVISQRFPGRTIIVVSSGNDNEIKRRVFGLKESLGGLQTSPLSNRVFAVVDSVHVRGLKEDLVKLGLSPGNFVAWSGNGVEYLYPESILASIFGCLPAAVSGIEINGDQVALNGITLSKNDLCERVLKVLDASTILPQELEEKLLAPLAYAISD